MQPGNPLRPWLMLGRVSNLPTVWSNCLAGWLLGGAKSHWSGFLVLCGGATLLYTGGMYLNDAFDADFDKAHRRERPIPAGAITEAAVWRAGIVLLLSGAALLSFLGVRCAVAAIMLAASIVVYDAIHKMVTFSPVLMALCRFILYVAASAAAGAVAGLAVWAGLALGSYIAGISYLARRESTHGEVRLWPLLLILVPIFLALLINDGRYRHDALLVAALFLLWAVRSLRSAFTEPRNVGRAVSGLLAGIVWVDLLAVADQPRERGAIFVGLFLLALLFQRFVPAT